MQATLFLKHMSNSVHIQTIRYLVQSQTDTSFSKEKPHRVFVDCPEWGRLWVVSVQIVSTSSIDDALAHRDVARWIVDESGAIRLEDRSSATRWVLLDFMLIGSRRYHLPRLGYAACKILVCIRPAAQCSDWERVARTPSRDCGGIMCVPTRREQLRLLFEIIRRLGAHSRNYSWDNSEQPDLFGDCRRQTCVCTKGTFIVFDGGEYGC